MFSASIVNQVFHKFLSRQPHTRSELKPPLEPVRERMTRALQTLADFKGDQSFASRDPLSPLSFSCVTEDIYRDQAETWNTYHVDENRAFSPLGPDGRPQRK